MGLFQKHAAAQSERLKKITRKQNYDFCKKHYVSQKGRRSGLRAMKYYTDTELRLLVKRIYVEVYGISEEVANNRAGIR